MNDIYEDMRGISMRAYDAPIVCNNDTMYIKKVNGERVMIFNGGTVWVVCKFYHAYKVIDIIFNDTLQWIRTTHV